MSNADMFFCYISIQELGVYKVNTKISLDY